MEAKYKIGYIDEDIRQVKKYTRRLKDFGFEVIGYDFHQGMSLEELMSQVYESDIDLLMIDYKLKESNIVAFNGDAVESEFYEKRPLFPHIIFTNKVEQAEPFIEDWKILFDKENIFSEDGNDEQSVKRFVTILTKSIEQYKNHIEKKKDKISFLLFKINSTEFSSVDENELIKLQKELMNLDKTFVQEIPEKLISYEKLDKISTLRIESEEFLDNLIKSKKDSGS